MEYKTKCCNPANMGATRGSAKIDWIVIHYTSNLGDTAKNNADYFAREKLSYKASAHFFVDEKEVWSSVPAYRTAYHCGAKKPKHPHCRNSNSLGVEICMLDKHAVLRKGSICKAAELVRWLMKEYGVDEDHVIRHYDVTGKDCPAPMVENPALWEEFLSMLSVQEDDMKRYKYYDDMPAWAQPTVSKLVKLGILKGEGDGVLDLSEDMLRMLVINDRAGVYK